MNPSATDIDHLERIDRSPEAWRLATAAYDALLDLLTSLSPEEWERPTVCEPWSVADMVRHLLGAAEAHASIPEFLRQQVWAMGHKGEYDGNALDAWTGLHIRRHADVEPDALLARLRDVAPRAVRARSRFPALPGRIPVPVDATGNTATGSPDRVTLGELNTVIFTRDTWLHRIDIARAVDREPNIDPDIDSRIVEDVVIEWAHRHGAPFRLTLTGPAGGDYAQGADGPEMELDAVRFAWILSGRDDPAPNAPGAELLTARVLF
ncbi:MAG: maleylpyruvate isomerase family mycothiol-dependent enzyme [Nitriliruptoraceae bacterium]